MRMAPEQLRNQLRGLFSFPVTPFTAEGEIDLPRFREHVRWMIENRPAALFVCGGTGEFFSLNLEEYRVLVGAAAEAADGQCPVIAGTGYGAALAAKFAEAAEEAGADGLLVFPPYLIQPEQDGLEEHYRRIAASTSLGLILYQRDNAIFAPATVGRLSQIKNIVGFKDGLGDMERLLRIQREAGERLAILNGMPTAELSAPAFLGLGVLNYSSAVFNFVPDIARAFYQALRKDDRVAINRLLDAFYRPLAQLRERRKGYAVALIKAGLRVVGKPAGNVRPPLVDCNDKEEAELKVMIEAGQAVIQNLAPVSRSPRS